MPNVVILLSDRLLAVRRITNTRDDCLSQRTALYLCLYFRDFPPPRRRGKGDAKNGKKRKIAIIVIFSVFFSLFWFSFKIRRSFGWLKNRHYRFFIFHLSIYLFIIYLFIYLLISNLRRCFALLIIRLYRIIFLFRFFFYFGGESLC